MSEPDRFEIVDIAVKREDKFLVVTNRKHDGYTFPGGKIEPGEHIADAASRELMEETGLVVPAGELEYVGFLDYVWHGRNLRCHAFIAQTNKDPMEVEIGTKIAWASKEELLDMDGKCLAPVYYGWLIGKMNW